MLRRNLLKRFNPKHKLLKRDLKKRLRCSKKRRERDVCVGAKSKRLVERYGSYILVGDDEVVRNE